MAGHAFYRSVMQHTVQKLVRVMPGAMPSRRAFASRLSLLLLGGLLALPASGAENARKLFNGRNLDGWRAYLSEHRVGMEDVWSVRDGILICKGEPMGYLYTKDAFTNFRVNLEWRWAPGEKPGNSGLLMRINGKPMPLPRCLEMQLKSGSAGDLYGFHGMKLSGAAARLTSSSGSELAGDLIGVGKIQANEKTPGEWNTAEVTLDGGKLEVRVNGMLVNEATDCDVAAGPVAVQSEGGEVHFRKIELTPLP
jgi:hypothetical protein